MPRTRQLAAIMFTDIEGYTSLMQKNEEDAVRTREQHRRIFNSVTAKHNGRVLQYYGDGTLSIFDSAVDAVQCGVEMQLDFQEEPSIPVRIGIHSGDIIFSEDDIIGDGVNVASRIESLAVPGSVFISDKVYDEIKNQDTIKTTPMKTFKLKNVERPIEVFAISNAGLVVPKPEDIEGKTETKSDPASLPKMQDEPERTIPKRGIYALIIASIIIAAIIGFLKFGKDLNLAPNGREKSIAVRPFWNESADKENEYFVIGMAEDIRNDLAKIADLQVRSRGSVEKYRDSNHTTKDIASELEVSYVLEGTVQKVENQIKIHAQLIFAENDDHVWEDTYVGEINEAKDVFEMQSQIAQSIANKLEVIITPREKQNIETIPTENLEAYDLYLKGNEYSYKGGESNLNTANKFYQLAIELDPEFSLAYLGVGGSYFALTYWSDYFKENFGDTLIYFVDKALSINPELAEAYMLRGFYYEQNGDFANSIKDLNKAIDLNPNYGDAYWILGLHSLGEGQYVDAIIKLEKAGKLKKGDADYQNLLESIGYAYVVIGDYGEAEVTFRELAESDPIAAYVNLGMIAKYNGDLDRFKLYADKMCEIDSGSWSLKSLGDYAMYNRNFEEARRYYSRVFELVNSFDQILLSMQHRYGFILTNLGEIDEAQIYFDKQIEFCLESIRLNRSYNVLGRWASYDLAGIYAFTGNKEKTYQILSDMESDVFPGNFVSYMQNDPLFADLWGEEEFQQIIKRQENRYADMREEVDHIREEGPY